MTTIQDINLSFVIKVERNPGELSIIVCLLKVKIREWSTA